MSSVSIAWLVLAAALFLGGCSGGGDSDDDGQDNQSYSLPANDDANFVFAVIGDFGDTLPLSDEPDTQEVATLIKSWKPSFITTVGDNDYSDGEYANQTGNARFTGLELGVGQFFHEYIYPYKGSSGSGASTNMFYPIPGDHDYGDDCENPRLGPYLDYFTLPEGPKDETYYELVEQNVHIFFLDSIEECHQDNGATLAAQKAWLSDTAKKSEAEFKIVLIHQPPYSSGARHGSAAHTQWNYADMGIDLVISGDDHIYERIEKDGVTYLVNGLGGVEIHPDFSTPVEGSKVRYNKAYGALRVDVYESRLLVSFVSVDGVVQDQFSLNSGKWYKPAVSATWQWQLQGTINTAYNVDVYDIDLFDAPQATIDSLHAAGKKVICYFSAGSYEDFRDDAAQFQASDLGNGLEGWPDEKWLDTRSSNVRNIMKGRLDLAATKKCDGVEPDNMDAYETDNKAGFASDPLTAADQLDYNRFIANEAHARELAVGLKNDLPQIPDLVEYFDFAVNEQCHQYNECADLKPFTDAGKPVFNAEYPEEQALSDSDRDAVCAAAKSANIRTLILPLDLDDSSRHSCD